MDEWLREHLVCPRDKQELKTHENRLVCPQDHAYPVVGGIPIMLLEETEQTHGYIAQTLDSVAKIEASGIVENAAADDGGVDPFVQAEIPYTSGHLYVPLQNKLKRYPIPEIRLPQGSGERLLDVGCNWGRWSIAAARKGYSPIGIDPSLNAVTAARRIARQLGLAANFVVGDARSLPFASNSFDIGFSYSVFQHFSKENAKTSLEEVSRAVKPGGRISVQMPNKYGIRSFYQQAKRGFSEGSGFDTRYWTPGELTGFFSKTFGETQITVDCYFGLGIQKSDVDLLPLPYRAVVHSSELLRKISRGFQPLVNVADSLYLDSINRKPAAEARMK
jgi:SAM-dependent methyltransferase/uncharacterized protein YbaR (Trm112 family)